MSKRDDIIWKEFLEYDENSPTCLRWIDPYRKGRGGKPVKRVNGVAFSVVKTKCGNYTERYVATASLDGKKKTKAFSPFVYGYEQAFKLACEWREKMIAEFNEQGAGYTERHGT